MSIYTPRSRDGLRVAEIVPPAFSTRETSSLWDAARPLADRGRKRTTKAPAGEGG